MINSSQADPVAAVKNELGRGIDVDFEALGSVSTVKLAVDLLDDWGRAVLAGIAPAGDTMDVDITQVVYRKLRILGAFGASASQAMPAAIDLAAQGKLELGKLITVRFQIAETALAYEPLSARDIRWRGLIETNPAIEN